MVRLDIKDTIQILEKHYKTRQSEMADLARRATRWVGTLSDGNVHVKFHDDRLRNGGDITY